MKALEGTLVVSLEQAVAAPLASCRLADAGARVIKLERPGGDFSRNYDRAANGLSSYFAWLNRGKESLVVDIKNAEDKALLHHILEKADVFIQNLAVGAAERAGLGSDTLRDRYPRLITCDISGYGEEGPYRDMKAYDLLVQAESGLVSVNGAPGAYGRVGVSVCDIATGMNAAMGIQEALIKREKTGKGESVKVSLFDSMADWMTVPYLHQVYLGEAPQRVGLAHPSIAPYGEFRTSEGDSILISIQNEREWKDFVEDVLEKTNWLSDPRFKDNHSRVENRNFVDNSIQEVMGQMTKKELEQRLNGARIAWGAVNDMKGLQAHPQLRTVTVKTENGELNYPAPPVRHADDANLQPVPAIDEHGESIRKEFAGANE